LETSTAQSENVGRRSHGLASTVDAAVRPDAPRSDSGLLKRRSIGVVLARRSVCCSRFFGGTIV